MEMLANDELASWFLVLLSSNTMCMFCPLVQEVIGTALA
jgi:hypothetical protein